STRSATPWSSPSSKRTTGSPIVRALRLDADWEPRSGAGAALDPADSFARLGRRGNQVWRNPRIAVVSLPDPSPSSDEVVIRVRACGICGSDFHLVEADDDGYMLYPGLVRTPVVTGHEFAGVVEAVGPDVRDFAPGDAVCAEEIAWCGDCLACRAGRPNNCVRIEELGFSFDGAHAEYVVTRARYCWSLAPLLGAGIAGDRVFQLGALVEPTGVAYVAMFVSAGGFMPGSSIGVVGAGPIGLAAIALARAAGAGRIVAFEVSDRRRALATAMGADQVLDPHALGPDGFASAAREISYGRGIDLWVEASGAAGVAEMMAASLAPAGRLVLVGRGPHTIDLDPEWLIVRGAGIQGSIGHSGSGTFGHVIDLMAAGRLDMTRIVSATVDLDGAARLLDGTPRRDSGKTLVVP
ncbi:MAG TPA: scyllo-inosose 3-dehydrogenase, partial [Candidatus Limnocylindrales bacterium]|nr:scyllo-inosose 3-dehydrogenase [Candidatus Limnocylindrales bacterium]